MMDKPKLLDTIGEETGNPTIVIGRLVELVSWDATSIEGMFNEVVATLEQCCKEGNDIKVRSKALMCATEKLIPASRVDITRFQILFDSLGPQALGLFGSCSTVIDSLVRTQKLSFDNGRGWLRIEGLVLDFFKRGSEVLQGFKPVALSRVRTFFETSVRCFLRGAFGNLETWGGALRSCQGVVGGQQFTLEAIAVEMQQTWVALMQSLLEFLNGQSWVVTMEGSSVVVSKQQQSEEGEAVISVCKGLVEISEASNVEGLRSTACKVLLTLLRAKGTPQNIEVSEVTSIICETAERVLSAANERTPRYLRLLLLILNCLCKSYSHQLSSIISRIISLIVNVRSKLPPSRHSPFKLNDSTQLSESSVPPLERFVARGLQDENLTEEQRWGLVSLCCIFPNTPPASTSDDEVTMGKLIVLSTFLSSNEISNHQTILQMVGCVSWVMEGLRQCCDVVVFTPSQPSTTLWTRTWMALCRYCVKLQKTNGIHLIEPLLLQGVLDSHFLVRRFSTEVWAFLLRHSTLTYHQRIVALFHELIRQTCLPPIDKRLEKIQGISEVLRRLSPALQPHARTRLFQMIAPNPLPQDGLPSVVLKVSLLPLVFFKEDLRDVLSDLFPRLLGLLDPSKLGELSFYSLYASIRCLRAVSAPEVVDTLTRAQRLTVTSLINQLLARNGDLKSQHPEVLRCLIEVAAVLSGDMKVAEVLSLVTYLDDIVGGGRHPEQRMAVAHFLTSCSKIEVTSNTKATIQDKFKSLFQKLLTDPNWPVCNETMRGFSSFSRVASAFNPKGLIPEDSVTLLAGFLSGKPFPIEGGEDLVEQLEVQKRTLQEQAWSLNSTRSKKRSRPPSNDPTLETRREQISRGVTVMKEGFGIVESSGGIDPGVLTILQRHFDRLIKTMEEGP